MDFIEKIFGVSPDGGSGAFEFILFAIPIIVLVILAVTRRGQKKKEQR